jgi:hypothetical protein
MAERPPTTLVDGVDLSQHVADPHRLAASTVPGGGHPGFVVRYTTPDTPNNPQKQIKAPELAAIRAADLALCVVSETTAGRALAGYAAGRADARTAAAYCASLGMPPDMVIHWAADEDLTGAQVDAYARGWRDEIGLARCGAYGGIKVISYLYDHHLISYGWQAYAWSAGKLDPRATAYQWRNDVSLAGNTVDLDAALGGGPCGPRDYGQWEAGAPAGDRGVIDMTTVDLTPAAITAVRDAILAAPIFVRPAGEQTDTGLTLAWAARGAYFRAGKAANDQLPDVQGRLAQLGAGETAEAVTLAGIKAEVDALTPAAFAAAVIAELPQGGAATYTPDEIASAVVTALGRTQISVTVAPPPAG